MFEIHMLLTDSEPQGEYAFKKFSASVKLSGFKGTVVELSWHWVIDLNLMKYYEFVSK